MAVLPPVATNPPPELNVAKDGKEQAYKLINWLRRRVVGYAPGLGAAWFATAIGRGDGIPSRADGVELIGLQFHLAVAYPAFSLNFAGEVADSGSGGVFRIRLGGTWGVANSGTAVATLNASAPGFVYATTTVPITANLETLVTMTVQSTVGHTAQFRGGSVVGN